MDLNLVRQDLRDALARPNHPSQITVTHVQLELVLDHLDAIERRADQIEGGLTPYARPPEIARYVTGREGETPVRIPVARDTTVTTTGANAGTYTPVPWAPPMTVQAGGQILFTDDGQIASVYGPHGELVQVYELHDGAMRPAH